MRRAASRIFLPLVFAMAMGQPQRAGLACGGCWRRVQTDPRDRSRIKIWIEFDRMEVFSGPWIWLIHPYPFDTSTGTSRKGSYERVPATSF